MLTESRTDEGLMTIADVCSYLAVCRTTVMTMLRRGDLPSVRIGTARRVPRQAVRELATRGLERKGAAC